MTTSTCRARESVRLVVDRLLATAVALLPGFRSATPKRNVLVALVYLLLALALVGVAAELTVGTPLPGPV